MLPKGRPIHLKGDSILAKETPSPQRGTSEGKIPTTGELALIAGSPALVRGMALRISGSSAIAKGLAVKAADEGLSAEGRPGLTATIRL